MPQLRLADLNLEISATSPLGECLVRLDAQSQHSGDAASIAVDPEPMEWHSRWSANQQQITRRLQLIEAELDRLTADGQHARLAVYSEQGEPAV